MKQATYERLFGKDKKLPPLPQGWKERVIQLVEKAEAESPQAEELVISQVERMLRITKYKLAQRK